MIPILLHRLAAREYQKARDRYERIRRGLGDELIEEVGNAIQRIVDNPEAWPIFRGNLRWVSVHRFPYILYYRVLSPTVIQILAVAHTSRRQGYWIRRVGSN